MHILLDDFRYFGVVALISCTLLIACNSNGGGGVQHCVEACQTLLTTNCETQAVDFCKNAQENCEARYNAHPSCQAQLEAMDECAGDQPATRFVCPLGTIADEIRPYRLSEDACVNAAIALGECL